MVLYYLTNFRLREVKRDLARADDDGDDDAAELQKHCAELQQHRAEEDMND